MKKLFVFLAAAIIFASCENVIKYEYDKNDAEMTILSVLDASKTDHFVILSMSYPDRVEALKGASVVCTVNGVEHRATEVPEEEDPDDYWRYRNKFYTEYAFFAEFKPGDQVRVEAVKGDKKAWCDLVVPQAGIMSQVDTQTVVRTIDRQQFYGADTYEDAYLDVSAKITDIVGEDSFFTLNAFLVTDMTYYWTDEEGKDIRSETVRSESRISYETFNDRILEDGYASQTGTLLEELLPTNVNHGFSDRFFKDGVGEVKFSLDSWSVSPQRYYSFPDGASRVEVTAYLDVRLAVISHDYYNYLRALNNMETYGFDVSPIVEPTMLPSNVTDGFGMVSIAPVTTVSFKLYEETFTPGEYYYYY